MQGAVIPAQGVQLTQGLAGEDADLRIVTLGLEFGEHHGRQHHVVFSETVDRPRIGDQHGGIHHVGPHCGVRTGRVCGCGVQGLLEVVRARHDFPLLIKVLGREPDAPDAPHLATVCSVRTEERGVAYVSSR
jgi:hypothetical protein